MKTHIFNHHHSIFNNYLAEIRNVHIQQDRLRFRTNLERMGEIMAYEVSKSLTFASQKIQTPLAEAEEMVVVNQPVVASVLRAGLPLHQGVLRIFDHADNGFISAYRKHHKDGTFEIEVEYISSPALDNRVLILSDPMLATGRSMILSLNALLQKGTPSSIHILAAIASTEGMEFVQKNAPKDAHLWIGAVDSEMTAQAYIVPGLGDAGDLAFGAKD